MVDDVSAEIRAVLEALHRGDPEFRRLAERADVVALPSIESRVSRIHQLLFGRPPNEDELEGAKKFLGEAPSANNWAGYVHALMMTNEFVFLD